MPRTAIDVLRATFGLAVFLALGCGSNSGAIHVSPASADAQNYSGGVVPYSASGVTNPTWCIGSPSGACNGFIISAATIDSTGHAHCVSGQSGTVTVLAGTGGHATNPDEGVQLSVFGTAQLTCP